MSQKSSVMQLPQFVPKALTSDSPCGTAIPYLKRAMNYVGSNHEPAFSLSYCASSILLAIAAVQEVFLHGVAAHVLVIS